MQAVEGIYHNGRVNLLEAPKEIKRARVIVTFLNDEPAAANDNQSLVGSGEILDDDLEAASLEIREEFLAAIEKSSVEFDKQ